MARVLLKGEQNFSDLCLKFTRLLHVRGEGNREYVEEVLDELNSLNYRYQIVNNPTKAVLLMNQCCTLIPPDDPTTVSKCCQLITNLERNQQVIVEGRTLDIVVQWCLEALAVKKDEVIVDVLVALEALLRNCTESLDDLIPQVIQQKGRILDLASQETSTRPEVVLFAVRCLETCLVPPKNIKSRPVEKYGSYFEPCGEIFKNHLIQGFSKFNELIWAKIMISCLRGLNNIILQYPDYLHRDLGVLLGLVRSYIVLGIQGVEPLTPTKLMPSALTIPEPATRVLRDKKGGKVTRQRKHKRAKRQSKKREREADDDRIDVYTPGNVYTPANLNFGTEFNSPGTGTVSNQLKSDSDFSDNESGRAAKLCIIQGRVRQAASTLFSTIISSTDKNTIFSYWSSFVPENHQIVRHDLTTAFLRDPSPRGRMSALNSLLLLLTSVKFNISQAESHGKSSAAFTSFSELLGLTVIELHRSLILALHDSSNEVVIQALQCLSALVQCTPYHRLPAGMLSRLLRTGRAFLRHRDINVQVATLIVLGCALVSEPTVPEVKETLMTCSRLVLEKDDRTEAESKGENDDKNDDNTKNDIEVNLEYVDFSSDEEVEEMSQLRSEEEGNIPWLVERCLDNLGVFNVDGKNSGAPTPIKIETLQVLSAMCRNYLDVLILPHLSKVARGLEISVRDKNHELCLHVGRTLDSLGQAMTRYYSNQDQDVNYQFPVDRATTFWLTVLSGTLQELYQCGDQCPALKACASDCLGSIGPEIYVRLPECKQKLIISLLFAASRDDESIVKAAAVRALGISVLYPTLYEDTGFVVDTASSILRLLDDEIFTVRIKASWALANACEAVLENRESGTEDEFPLQLLLVLLNASVKCCGEADRLKVNAVRALGSLLQALSIEMLTHLQLGEKFLQIVQDGTQALVRCATESMNMKVRWNACYALGNVLKSLPLYYNNTWQEAIFGTLSELVVKFRNFKVRIKAALALSRPPNRKAYGTRFVPVWNALVDALETSNNLEDFTEYKHKDHLVEQICLSLAHMASLVTREDLVLLENCITANGESLRRYFCRVRDHLLPEKTIVLDEALQHLNNLNSDEKTLSLSQRISLKGLLEVLTVPL